MKVRAVIFCAVLMLLVCGLATAGEVQKAGKWEVTMTMEMPGMPAKMPPMTHSYCVTKEQAENPQPPKMKKNDDCKVTDYKLEGKTLTYTVTCEKQNVSGKGKFTYSSDSFEGEQVITMGDHEMTQKFAGKYLGACDDSK